MDVATGVLRARARRTRSVLRGSEILLVPWMVAGVETQYQQLRRQQGFEGARVIEVHPYRQGALIERLPLPSSLRGTIRSSVSAAPSLLARGLRAVWTQVALPMLPFALWPRRAPIFYAIDCTPMLLHRSGHYRGVDSPGSPQGKLTAACLRLYFRHCAALLPWSTWAARSMINDYGAAPEKVHVVPPGIDVDTWHPVEREGNPRPRLLFVGADFERKGGSLLVDVYQRHLRDECELHMVTRRATDAPDGVHVHSGLKSGDAKLRELYQTSDALVLPTLADCYSMAALEAMACGLPIVISAVGGIPEIVVDGHTGILIEPGRGDSLLQGIRRLLASAPLRRRMGDAGRRRAEMLFDSRQQVAKTLDIMAGGAGL